LLLRRMTALGRGDDVNLPERFGDRVPH